MPALMFVEGDDVVTYLQPAPEALNHMAREWWANLIQRCHGQYQKRNPNYGAQFSSSIAAAYEIQSWELPHKKSELSKACFFRRLALALASKANNDTMAALKAGCALSLLVKATSTSEKCFVLEALRLAREAVLLKTNIAGTKMVLARILLWSICDSDAPGDATSDLEVTIKYIEESNVEFCRGYGAHSYLQRALEARYIIRGEEDDMQRVLSLARGKGSENLEEVANSHLRRLSFARKDYVANNRALDEIMRDMEWKASKDATQVGSQPQGLRKIYHLMLPSLAREALEAGLLACQSPVKVDNNRKQPASNFLIGITYLARGGGRQYDLESAIYHLEAACNEEPAGTEEHLQSSLCLAEARWSLGRATQGRATQGRATQGRATQVRATQGIITLLQAGMESMALLLESFTEKVHPSTTTLFDMMDLSYSFWESSQHVRYLFNAAKFASYLLREDKSGESSPVFLSQVLSKTGEIAAEMSIVQPDQTLLQKPLAYWGRCWQSRQAPLENRLHAMHLASQHLCRQKNYTDAFQYAKKAVELIRFACPAHLDVSKREGIIPLLNGISVGACALGIKLGRDKEALELLEQGRGILNFLPDAFADYLSELHREDPRLFMKFDQCRQSVLAAFNSRDPAELTDVRTKNPNGNNDEDDVDQLTSVLEEIRRKPRFKNFYRPITAAEMQSLATKGPIVVLVGSPLLPYAVIVQQQSIRTVDLSPEAVNPSLSLDYDFHKMSFSHMSHILGRELVHLEISPDQEASLRAKKLSDTDKAESLRGLLSFLWLAVVGPINKVLEFEAPQGSTVWDSVESSWNNRITWIRTGSFSRMPVHVATDDRNVPFISRAINSYVASFQSLSLSQSRHKAAQQGLKDGLLVTMPSKTSKFQTSAQVNHELSGPTSDEIRSFSRDGPFLKAENVEEEVSAVTKAASAINWSILERPSAEHVKDSFSNARFIHFICHGVEDQHEPRRSHLKLWKETTPGKGRVDPLFVSDISTWLTRKTALVFLSACSVADAESAKFSDESLDIANSFAVAGVPDIVGSMWPVSSSVATKVATVFWAMLSYFFRKKEILNGDIVARALQIAILGAASNYPSDPLMWAGFIHVGGMSSQSLTDVRDSADCEIPLFLRGQIFSWYDISNL